MSSSKYGFDGEIQFEINPTRPRAFIASAASSLFAASQVRYVSRIILREATVKHFEEHERYTVLTCHRAFCTFNCGNGDVYFDNWHSTRASCHSFQLSSFVGDTISFATPDEQYWWAERLFSPSLPLIQQRGMVMRNAAIVWCNANPLGLTIILDYIRNFLMLVSKANIIFINMWCYFRFVSHYKLNDFFRCDWYDFANVTERSNKFVQMEKIQLLKAILISRNIMGFLFHTSVQRIK